MFVYYNLSSRGQHAKFNMSRGDAQTIGLFISCEVTVKNMNCPLVIKIYCLADYRQHVISNTSAMQSNTDGVITVAWTPTNSTLVSRHFDRYEIQYRRCVNQQNDCVDSQSMTITDTTTSHYSLTDVIPLSTYEFNITLVKKSDHLFLPGVSGLSATVTVNITAGNA